MREDYYKEIEELDISVRALNELHAKGISLVVQLTERCASEIKELGLSKKTLKEIKDYVERM